MEMEDRNSPGKKEPGEITVSAFASLGLQDFQRPILHGNAIILESHFWR